MQGTDKIPPYRKHMHYCLIKLQEHYKQTESYFVVTRLDSLVQIKQFPNALILCSDVEHKK